MLKLYFHHPCLTQDQAFNIAFVQSEHDRDSAALPGAKVSAVVNAIIALRAKLGGGNEGMLVTPSGAAGIVSVRALLTRAAINA